MSQHLKPSYWERVNVNAAKKLRLITAKHMRNKETLLREWDNEIRKMRSLRVDKRLIWGYYKEQMGAANAVGLLEELYNTCLDISHKNTHGSGVGSKRYES